MSDSDRLGKHAFLCYVREDTPSVDRLQATLESAGIRVWRDTSELWPGEDWREKIRQAITGNALVFVACFSRASLAQHRSRQNEELAWAVDELRQRPPDVPWLIPVRLDDCEIPDRDLGGGRRMGSLQPANVFGDRLEDETARLVGSVTRILEQQLGSLQPASLDSRHGADPAWSVPDVELVGRSPGGDAKIEPAPGSPGAGRREPARGHRTISGILLTSPAVLSLAAALLAMLWTFFRVAAVLALAMAGTILWVRRRRGRPWADRSVVVTATMCVTACAVLAATFAWHASSLRPSAANRLTPSGRPTAAASRSSQSAALPGPQGSSAAPASGMTGAAANSPARVESVTPLNMEPDYTWATAAKVRLTPQQLAQLNAHTQSGGFDAAASLSLLASVHAVPTEIAYTNVTVTGNAKGTVTIVGMQVVKQCQAPLTGTLFYRPSQGINTTIGLSFNLDSPIDYARNGPFNRGNFFKSHVVTLRPGEVETFNIRVSTDMHYCQFSFEMTVAAPGGSVTETINDNGEPFEITGLAQQRESFSRYSYMYVGGVEASLTPSLHDPKGNFVQVDPKTYPR